MKYQEFEKILGQKLSSHKEEVDINNLLSALDLAPQQKSRSAFWWIFSSLGALILLAAVFYNVGSKSQKTAKNLDLALVHNRAVSIENNSQIDELQPTSAQKDNPEHKLSATPTHIIEKSEQSIEFDKITPLSVNKKSNFENSDGRKSTDHNSFFEKNGWNVIPNNESSIMVIDSKVDQLSTQKPNAEIISEYKSRIIFKSVDIIPSKTIEISDESQSNEALFTRMKVNCPSFGQGHFHIALIPEIGIVSPVKRLANKFGEASPTLSLRKTDEKSLAGYSIGLNTMIVRDDMPFYIRGGLMYTDWSERMAYQYAYTEQDTTIGIISSTVSANGDTITHIYGDIITETTYRGEDVRHYRIGMIDLPIAFGFTSYLGGFDIGLEGGVKINLATFTNGQFLDKTESYVTLDSSPQFRKRIGLSYFGGLMIGRNFGKFGDFYIAPRFTYHFDDLTSSVNPVSQSYLTLGMHLGYVYTID